MGSQHVVDLTPENFEDKVLSSGTKALVDFWASWCMPCRMLAPVVEELAEEYAGQLTVGKVNTDEARDLALRYSITALPTVILLDDGQMVGQFVGLQQKSALKAAIDKMLG